MRKRMAFVDFVQRVQAEPGFEKFALVLGVILLYFCYVAWTEGIALGFTVVILTWCFFVFGTPVADAGALVDFPVRIITNNPFYRTEWIVFGVAATIIGVFLWASPKSYEATFLTRLLYKMATRPLSLYGMIVVLSIIGTLVSAYLENDVYNRVLYDKGRLRSWRVWGLAVAFVLIWMVYIGILYHLGIQDRIYLENR